ncbi:MAG: ATP-binding protein [Gemmatimonadota bacterium]
MPPVSNFSELQASLLQAAITTGLVGLCIALFRWYHKPYFRWWAIAWGIYVFRIACITLFLTRGSRYWLYWHQVATGWTALAILGAALLFSNPRALGRWYFLLLVFPPIWSYIAIYRLDNFLLASGPAVLFLSLATLWTAWVFLSHRTRTGSRAALMLAITFALWGLHHLDYPILRARGAWNPWGYYLDILFTLATGFGILLLVMEDLRRGLGTLSALSGDLHFREGGPDILSSLLERPLSLAGVKGSAMYLASETGGHFARGAGVCASWSGAPTGAVAAAIEEAVGTGRPVVGPGMISGYTAVLPVIQRGKPRGALVIVGGARDPFTALDEDFLVALGQQVGAALENAELYQRLEQRARELEMLSMRMVRQNEEQRHRLSLSLHDETAQVFSVVKLQLGLVREQAGAELTDRLDRVLGLIDSGISGIRNVTNDLRPSLLDDLGWLSAIRALVQDFAERSGLAAHLEAPRILPAISKDAELALFRAVQEGLSNVARHASAASVMVRVLPSEGGIVVRILDDGVGLPSDMILDQSERSGHLGLAGMRERITAVGGRLDITGEAGAGVRIDIHVPHEAKP